MPREKYRVHEVAKDFGINSKKILEILEKYTDEPRKHMTALEDRELDLIFETITQENEVQNFDAYFAAGEAQKKAKEEAAAEVKEEVKAEVKAEAKAEKKAEAKKKAIKAEKTNEQILTDICGLEKEDIVYQNIMKYLEEV